MLSATVWVDNDFTSGTTGWGVDHFATIQEGVNAVDSGGTVSIQAGTYAENVTAGSISTYKQVNFVGIPDPEGKLPTLLGSLYLDNDDNAIIKNIKFQVNPASLANTLTLKNTNVLTVSDCVFDGSGLYKAGMNGVNHVSGPNGNSYVTIEDCLFTNGLNVAIGSRISHLTVKDSIIEDCASGINQMGGNDLVVQNTDISVVAQGADSNAFGVRFGEASGGPNNNVTITGCTISVDENGFTAITDVYHSAFIVRASAAGTLTVSNSSIVDGVVNLSATSISAAGNWWGTTDAAQIAELVTGAASYTPWLTNGTDLEPTTPGFQPSAVDTEAPAAPSVTLASDTGASDTDRITRLGALTLSGVEVDAVVEYSIDGGATWTASFTAVEGLNTVMVRQTDLAGNVSGATTFSFTLDTVAPTIGATLDKMSAGTGWYNIATGAPTATFTGADVGGSGVASVSRPYTFAEGAHLSATGTVTDVAGNSMTARFFDVSVDLTAPTLTASVNSPSATGWYNQASGPAVVTYSASDATSGVATPAPHAFSDGVGMSLAAITVTDAAGNTSAPAGQFSGINQDTVAPTIGAALNKAPAATGWYNIATGAPTATFTGADVGSGVASVSLPYTFAAGAHLSATGTVTDVAGNSTTDSFFNVSVDLTAPTLTASINPPSADGWYNKASGPAVVTYAASDATSGVATPAPYKFSDGVDMSVAAITVTDAAGNTSLPAGKFTSINQDTGRLASGIENRNGTLYIVGSRNADCINVMQSGKGEILVTIVGGALSRQQRVKTSGVGRMVVYGLGGNDLINVQSSVTLPATLFGNDGVDRLIAGGGPSVLVGGNGNDYLQATSGSAVLLGGSGVDYLLAGTRGALCVGGKTDFDNNAAALSAILNEWGTSATAKTLTRATVHDDQAVDYFSGGRGVDYYFANITGRVRDLIVGNRSGDRYQNIV